MHIPTHRAGGEREFSLLPPSSYKIDLPGDFAPLIFLCHAHTGGYGYAAGPAYGYGGYAGGHGGYGGHGAHGGHGVVVAGPASHGAVLAGPHAGSAAVSGPHAGSVVIAGPSGKITAHGSGYGAAVHAGGFGHGHGHW